MKNDPARGTLSTSHSRALFGILLPSRRATTQHHARSAWSLPPRAVRRKVPMYGGMYAFIHNLSARLSSAQVSMHACMSLLRAWVANSIDESDSRQNGMRQNRLDARRPAESNRARARSPARRTHVSTALRDRYRTRHCVHSFSYVVIDTHEAILFVV